MNVLNPFAPVFDKRTWEKAQVLTIGAILTPSQRTDSSALRVMGLDGEDDFSKYHQVLNRAVWSPLAVSRILLRLVLNHPQLKAEGIEIPPCASLGRLKENASKDGGFDHSPPSAG